MGVTSKVVERTVECAMEWISRHMGVEESMLVLQAVCTYKVVVEWKKWAVLQLMFVTLAEGEHDIIVLHAVWCMSNCYRLSQNWSN